MSTAATKARTACFFNSFGSLNERRCVGLDSTTTVAVGQRIPLDTAKEESIAQFIEADRLIYQKIEDLKEMYHDMDCCFACFDGCYPTGINADVIEAIEKERLEASLNPPPRPRTEGSETGAYARNQAESGGGVLAVR